MEKRLRLAFILTGCWLKGSREGRLGFFKRKKDKEMIWRNECRQMKKIKKMKLVERHDRIPMLGDGIRRSNEKGMGLVLAEERIRRIKKKDEEERKRKRMSWMGKGKEKRLFSRKVPLFDFFLGKVLASNIFLEKSLLKCKII